MSGMCGNCDCSDKSHCVKKGYTGNITERNSYTETTVMDAQVAENNGKCNCLNSCSCTNCTCNNCSCCH